MNGYRTIDTKIKWNNCQVLQTNILKNIGALECQNIGILEQQTVFLYNPFNDRMNIQLKV
jgi:hypothetical protein